MATGRSRHEWRLIVQPFGNPAYWHEEAFNTRGEAQLAKERTRRAIPSATVEVIQVEVTEVLAKDPA